MFNRANHFTSDVSSSQYIEQGKEKRARTNAPKIRIRSHECEIPHDKSAAYGKISEAIAEDVRISEEQLIAAYGCLKDTPRNVRKILCSANYRHLKSKVLEAIDNLMEEHAKLMFDYAQLPRLKKSTQTEFSGACKQAYYVLTMADLEDSIVLEMKCTADRLKEVIDSDQHEDVTNAYVEAEDLVLEIIDNFCVAPESAGYKLPHQIVEFIDGKQSEFITNITGAIDTYLATLKETSVHQPRQP